MNNDIRKLIEDNWGDIKELIVQKVEAEQKPKTIWDLDDECNSRYYYIDDKGSVTSNLFNGSVFAENRRILGNAFLIEKEAEFERERRKIEAIMMKHGRPFKYGEYDYCIEHSHNNNTLSIFRYSAASFGIPYFETREIAEKVIDEIGEDRLKKYWFGVTE